MKHLSPAEIETIRVPEPKHDPFTLESLVAWLERQPGETAYDYTEPSRCCLALYFQDMGFHDADVCFNNLYVGENVVKFPTAMKWVAQGEPDAPDEREQWTFGAALTRARAALASQKGNANG